MAALNPITHETPAKLAATLALDPAVAAEERLKQLLYLWLRRYFSGTPFTTRTVVGGTEQKTFTACLFDAQEGKLPDNPDKPVIHFVMPDRRSRREDLAPGERGHYDDWSIDLMVKVPSSLAGTAMAGTDADYLASKVGGELDWLLGSTERQALSEQGVMMVRLARPSVILPPTTWKMRMCVMTCRTRRSQAR